MCGRTAQLVKAKVEGTILDVCPDCAKFGKIETKQYQNKTQKYNKPIIKQFQQPKKEIIQLIMDDYPAKVKSAREKTGLTQEEFARKLNEKESTIQKIETGNLRPPIALARKIEKIINIKIIEEYDESGEIPLGPTQKKTEGFTIADFIKKR